MIELYRGNEQRFTELMQAALDRFDTTGNLISASHVHGSFAFYFIPRDNFQQADWHVQAMLSIARELQFHEVYHYAMVCRTWLALAQKDFDLVIRLCHENLEHAKDFPLNGRVYFYYFLCRGLLTQGKSNEARALIRQYFSAESYPYYRMVSHGTLHALGILAAQQGKTEQAALWFGVVNGKFGHLDYLFREMSSHERGEYEQALAAIRAALSPEAFEAGWNAGRAMSLERIMEIVQEDHVL